MRRVSVAVSAWLLTMAACQPAATTAVDPAPPQATARPAPAAPVEPAIDLQRMLTDVAYLSDDSLAGRDSRRQEAIVKAARYIAASHRTAGIPPAGSDYLVEFELEVDTKLGRDVHLWVELDGASEAMTHGYVVARTDWDGEPVFGPVLEAPAGQLRPVGVDGRLVVVRLPAENSTQRRARIAGAFDAGARGVIGVLPPGEDLPPLVELDEFGEGLPGPLLVMSEAAASQRMPWRDKPRRAARARPMPGLRISMAPTQEPVTQPRPNVLAALPGREFPREIVVIGAHYDHIGRESDGIFCRDPDRAPQGEDSICNGADDNASGTAMVMEIARCIAESSARPQRTIVFAHFAGEELGLLGSKALVEALDATPPFDEGEIVAMINLDMVGRYDEEIGLTIGSVSTSPGWSGLLDDVDPRGLSIVRDAAVNSRSDHASFHRVGVPVLFFFTGLHADYHRTSDELDRINTDGMNRIAQFVLDVTLGLASGPALRRPEQSAGAASGAGDANPNDLP